MTKKLDTPWCGLVTTKRSFSPSECIGSTAAPGEMESFKTSKVDSGQNIGTLVGVTNCETKGRWCDMDPLLAAYPAVVLKDGDCSYFLLGWEIWFTIVAGIPMVRK